MADAPGRGQAPDQPDDVVRGGTRGLGDDEDPVEAAAALAPHRRTAEASRRATASAATTASATGIPIVAPEARRVPAAAELAGQHRRVDAARLRAHRQAGRAVGLLLQQHRDLGGLRLGEQVDDPLGVRGERPGRREILEQQRRPDHEPVRRRLEAAQDAAEQPELRVGLRAVEAARQVGQRRADVDQRRRDRERARRGVGMGEGRGVGDDPGHQLGRHRPVGGPERHAEPDREQRDHLAGRGGVRVDPVPRSPARRSRRGGR